MASDDAPPSSLQSTSHTEPTNISQTPPVQRQNDELPSSSPVEMSQLPSQPYPQDDPSTSAPAPTAPRLPPEDEASELQPSTLQRWAPETLDGTVTAAPTTAEDPLPSMPATPEPAAIRNDQVGTTTRSRAESSGIGPSLDGPIIATEASGGVAVLITLLLTTGARHPYTIDQKYLRRRNVASASQEIDPFSISVYTLKELIWRDWREEWDPRPTSPSSIRLIHFGKLLDDKFSLKDCRFQPSTPNVVHMTVKPQELVDDEENAKTGKGAGRGRDDGDRDSGCQCCTIQ